MVGAQRLRVSVGTDPIDEHAHQLGLLTVQRRRQTHIAVNAEVEVGIDGAGKDDLPGGVDDLGGFGGGEVVREVRRLPRETVRSAQIWPWQGRATVPPLKSRS